MAGKVLKEFAGVEAGGFGEGEQHFGGGSVGWTVADLVAIRNGH